MGAQHTINATSGNGAISINTANVSRIFLDNTGNVGIGTTSPNANAKLHLYNSASATDVALRLTSNANSKTLIGFGDTVDQTAGAIKYDNATSEMSFEVLNSTEAMRINSSGNVGIGTTNPLSQLSIGSNAITTKKPTVVIADEVAGGSLVIRGLSPILSFDRTGANPENKILMDGAGLEFKTGTLDTEGDVDFKIKPDGKLQAPAYTQGFLQSDASGNIEISGGGTLPGGPYLPLAGGTMTGDLYLDDGNGATPSLYFKNGADNYWRYLMESGGDFSVKEGTSTRLTFQAGGNVGIGITNPTQTLQVDSGANGLNQGIPQSSGTTQNGILRLTPGDITYGETLDFGMNVGPTYAWIQSTNKDGLNTTYSLSLNPTGGNVGIGTTSPESKLQVQGDITIKGINTSRFIRFSEPTNSYQGGFINYDGNSNIFYFGTHNVSDQSLSNDVRAFQISRGSPSTTFNGNLTIPSYIYHSGDTNTLFGFGWARSFYY